MQKIDALSQDLAELTQECEALTAELQHNLNQEAEVAETAHQNDSAVTNIRSPSAYTFTDVLDMSVGEP